MAQVAVIDPSAGVDSGVALRLADDNAGSLVFLARSAWVLKREVDEWPDIAFVNVMERN